MRDRPYKIMLVESDPETIEIIVSSLTRRFHANITCAADPRTCLDLEMLEPHDLAIIDLETAGDLHIGEQLISLGPRPILFMGDRPSYHDAVTALRLGARDFFRKPFPVEQLLDAVDRALRQTELARRQARRYRRMRELVRQVIRERRSLNRRVELICRDLVQAQRNLVHRVVEFQESRRGQSRN
jgi:DNA-binding response OmpR family regulator